MKLRNGIWHMDVRVNGQRIRKSLETDDKLKAMLRQALEISAARSAPVPTTGTTLEAAYKHALRSRAKWRDAKDQRGIEGTYGEVAGYFGKDRTLESITDADVLTWIEAMQKDGNEPSTINRKLSHLSVLCKESRVAVPRMPRFTIPQGRIRVITDEELARVRAALRDAGNEPMDKLVLFLSHTAMRLSEALNLRRRDVDLERKLAHVWENKASLPRSVPLSEAACEVLLRRMAGHDLAPFHGITVDHADKAWARARKAIGLANDPQFVIHALRHTSLSRLAAAGVDAFRIQRFAGHKRIATTQKYVHLDVDSLRDLARVHDQPPNRSPAGETIGVPVAGGTVNPQVPGSSPGRGAK